MLMRRSLATPGVCFGSRGFCATVAAVFKQKRTQCLRTTAAAAAAVAGCSLIFVADAASAPESSITAATSTAAANSTMAGEMASALGELGSLTGNLGETFERLAHAYGSAEWLLVGYLHLTARKGQLYPAAAYGQLVKTLAFRQEHRLDRPEGLLPAIETARCRSHWPFAVGAERAPDGSPVEFCRLSRLNVPRIIEDFPLEEVTHFFALWCEHELRLLGESIRVGRPTRGALHIYDCSGVYWSQLLRDFRRHRATVAVVIGIGSDHWPDVTDRYFVINAPSAATLLWALLRPLVSERVQAKVRISRGTPAELVEALGGEQVLRRLQALPHVQP